MRLDRYKLTTELMKRNVTVKDFAQKAELSRATVIGVKSGKSCSYETGVKIAKALNVPLDELLEVTN